MNPRKLMNKIIALRQIIGHFITTENWFCVYVWVGVLYGCVGIRPLLCLHLTVPHSPVPYNSQESARVSNHILY